MENNEKEWAWEKYYKLGKKVAEVIDGHDAGEILVALAIVITVMAHTEGVPAMAMGNCLQMEVLRYSREIQEIFEQED